MTDFSADKTQYQAQLFENRLAKNYKQLKKWARKNRITAFRLYDRDIPELPLALDLYTFLPDYIETKMEAINFLNQNNAVISQNGPDAKDVIAQETQRTFAHLYLYERPFETDDKQEEEWMKAMAEAASKALGLEVSHIIQKTRKKQSEGTEGHRDQYEKIKAEKALCGTVLEQGELFKINLTEYIDTGLFFDHRPLRAKVRETCAGKSVLNLFCYTGSFSVYAAEGKAKRVESVDMSKTYLEWAQSNMKLNEFDDDSKYFYTRGDCVGFLNQKNAEVANAEGTNRYDIIVLDPPTFSNSKRTDTTLDINRDWPDLVNKCLNILKPKGVLYFSTNSRRLTFDENLIAKNEDGSEKFKVQDITASTIPEDYRNNKIHRAWKITEI